MLKAYLPVTVRIAGTLLVIAGLFVAHWWFYRLGPARRTSDPRWCSSHSQREYWIEIQKGIRRGVWNHDDGWAVGMYGDEAWAARIMNQIRQGDDFAGCFGGHKDVAMQFLTNHDFGEEADGWLDWWEQNQHKSQEQWIIDGFRQYDVMVTIPPTLPQKTALLALLDSAASAAPQIPEYVRYNAFRVLRDSGFAAVDFALADADLSEVTKHALVEYSRRLRYHPSVCGVGILPSGKLETDGSVPRMVHPKFQARVHAAIWLCFVVGAALVLFSYRRAFEWRKARARMSQFSLSGFLILIAMISAFLGGWVAREFVQAM